MVKKQISKKISYDGGKARKTVAQIIKNEDLTLKITYKTDALGDSVIIATGGKEEVEALLDVFNMVF